LVCRGEREGTERPIKEAVEESQAREDGGKKRGEEYIRR
jgi:hypothetical protein